jgi:glycosyltransferase involved in cell wall biosynthesis
LVDGIERRARQSQPSWIDSITVVTLTHERPVQLERALASVAEQDYNGVVEHLVVIDDDDAAQRRLEGRPQTERRSLTTHLVRRPPAERGQGVDRPAISYPRCARLLNVGVRLARAPWIAFLDDDNAFEPEHLRLLAARAQATRAPAVHSARQVLWPDGSAYLRPVFPHATDEAAGRRLYELLCRRGVWVRGTNILRDRVDLDAPTFRNSTIMTDDDPVFLVDQNVWLVRRDLLLRHPIAERFSMSELADGTCPDDKMLEALVRAGTKIVRTDAPTVRYFLGGMSNRQNDGSA